MAISAPDYSKATNLAKSQTKQYQALLNRQNKEQEGLFNQYYKQVKAQPTLTSLFNQQQDQYGLPQLQQSVGTVNNQIASVQGLLDNLDADTKARTSGTFTTQALLDRQRAVEGGALNSQLQDATSALAPLVNTYQVANQNIGTYLDAAQNDRDTLLKPIEARINSLSDKFARQVTGYTTSAQNELNTLLDKLKEQGQLYEDQQQRAQQLAAQEAQYLQARQVAASASANQVRQLPQLPQGILNVVQSISNGFRILQPNRSPQPKTYNPSTSLGYANYNPFGGGNVGGANSGFSLQG